MKERFKGLLSLWLAVAMIAAVLPVQVGATDGDYIATITTATKVDLSEYSNQTGTVKIIWNSSLNHSTDCGKLVVAENIPTNVEIELDTSGSGSAFTYYAEYVATEGKAYAVVKDHHHGGSEKHNVGRDVGICPHSNVNASTSVAYGFLDDISLDSSYFEQPYFEDTTDIDGDKYTGVYVFDGWRTKVYGTGDYKKIESSDNTPNIHELFNKWGAYCEGSGGVVTLYALWEKGVTVTYDYGDGTTPKEVVAEKRDASNKATHIVKNAPSCAGWQFLRWQGSDEKSYSPNESIELFDNITLTAQWAEEVTITFNKNYGDDTDDTKGTSE